MTTDALFTPPGETDKSAVISECGTYRYALRRIWDPATPPVLFVGLNPSTADAEQDDPTIRRCIRFAKDWGYGGLLMGNLYALRSTDPKALLTCWGQNRVGPVGPENDEWLRKLGGEAGIIVAAWGASKLPDGWKLQPGRAHMLLGRLHALGLTKDGQPRHPLYIRADARPVPLPDHQHDWGPWLMAEQSLEVRYCQTCGTQQWD